ncbi:MAG: hypothetical protein MJZ08_03735 [Bacteroidaceae bacterium]|nr:hypothetical protein [Bacteroidaceae bacterium]
MYKVTAKLIVGFAIFLWEKVLLLLFISLKRMIAFCKEGDAMSARIFWRTSSPINRLLSFFNENYSAVPFYEKVEFMAVENYKPNTEMNYQI